jgi:type III secretory pathway component EscS
LILEQVRIICCILFIYTPIIVSASVPLIINLVLYLLYAGEKLHKFNAKLPAATAQLQSQAKWYKWHLNQYALTRYGHKSIVLQKCTVLNHNQKEDQTQKSSSGYTKDFPLSPSVTLKCKLRPNVINNDQLGVVECTTHSKVIGLVS